MRQLCCNVTSYENQFETGLTACAQQGKQVKATGAERTGSHVIKCMFVVPIGLWTGSTGNSPLSIQRFQHRPISTPSLQRNVSYLGDFALPSKPHVEDYSHTNKYAYRIKSQTDIVPFLQDFSSDRTLTARAGPGYITPPTTSVLPCNMKHCGLECARL